jgi:dTDP-4-dehydrorhamnose reductase
VKVLIVGAAGQVGTELVACFRDDEVVAARRSDADLTDTAAVRRLVDAVHPDLIVNCAAFNAVDRCETEPELAMAVNAAAVGVLAEAAGALDAHLVTLSTDYVFDGTKTGPYVESDVTNPQSVYGQSKLAGEALAGPDSTIVRTSWVCSRTPPNMLLTALRLLDGDGTLRFVDDQIGCPTFAADLAGVVAELGRLRHAGIVHVTNQGAVSWFQFVQEIARQAGHDQSRVEAISTADLVPPRPAPRPANSVLASEVLPRLGLAPLRDHREPLRELVASL